MQESAEPGEWFYKRRLVSRSWRRLGDVQGVTCSKRLQTTKQLERESEPMNPTSSAVVVDFQLASGFERERQKLLDPQFADRLAKPLAYWARPNDRHLPLAFVGRSVRELIESPFPDLYATPGVGPKKIASLLRLLERVSEELAPADPVATAPASEERSVNEASPSTTVSEAHWSRWRQSVGRHGLHRETLGQLARSLQHLPRALWNAQLSSYLNLSLTEVRSLRTHGAKRVAAVLEIFENLARILEQLDGNPHLSVRFRPRLVQRVETWVQQQLPLPSAPSVGEVHSEFVAPLLEQLSIDGGDQHCDVARSRLERPNLAVRTLARQKGVTRGRLYELWADAATMAAVRWPEGQSLTARLHAKLLADKMEPAAQQLFESAMGLWFPEGRDSHPVSVRSELWHAVAEPASLQMTT